MTSLQKGTVQKCLKKLLDCGVIQDTGKKTGATGQVRIYRLLATNEPTEDLQVWSESKKQKYRRKEVCKEDRFHTPLPDGKEVRQEVCKGVCKEVCQEVCKEDRFHTTYPVTEPVTSDPNSEKTGAAVASVPLQAIDQAQGVNGTPRPRVPPPMPATNGHKKPLSPQAVFVESFAASFKELRRFEYHPSKPDFIQAAELLKTNTPEALLADARRAMMQTDPKHFWACINHSSDVKKFCAAINSIRSEFAVAEQAGIKINEPPPIGTKVSDDPATAAKWPATRSFDTVHATYWGEEARLQYIQRYGHDY